VLVANQAFDLASMASAAVNTAAITGAGGASGSITVTHDGGYGALGGKAVGLEPASGFTFDTPLAYRPR
jgi:hypothetical protein